MSDAESRRPDSARAFGWILGLLGLALMLLGGDEARRVVTTLTWPTVVGEVRSARVSSDTVAINVGKWRNSPVVEPRFHVVYAYRVGGTDYLGRQLDRLPVAERNARADLTRYSAGTFVSVHYDPAHPADAVLERRWPVRVALTGIAGVALLFVGWGLSRKTSRRRSAEV